MDYELTRKVLAALHAHGVAYKIFGAVALNLHGLARATEKMEKATRAAEQSSKEKPAAAPSP